MRTWSLNQDSQIREDLFDQNNISNEQLKKLLKLKPLDKRSLTQIMKMERLCHTDQWTAENFLAELQRPFTVAKGLWLDQTLVGLSLSWILPPECHLLNLMVHPKLWGRGLGRFLMEDLIQTTKNGQAYKIILEVKVGNQRAENLYRLLGFTGCGIRKGYYSDGSNAAIMTLELPGPIQQAHRPNKLLPHKWKVLRPPQRKS
jgi:ribosomal-protein-alanine N-acetyltransferase